MMVTRIYLAVVGLLYLALSVWCSVDPATTSSKVGFEPIGGSGKSEYLVIYGGLELGMALIFLTPVVQPDFTRAGLWACLLIHASLVCFRTASYFLYSDLSSMTHQLAAGEWCIFLGALACWWWSANSAP